MNPYESPPEGGKFSAIANAPAAPRWAWGVCWLMFLATALNYMDRQAMAQVGPQIRAEYGLDFTTFGWVLAVFQLTYAVAQVPAGFLADRCDVRTTYALAVAWWSLAGVASAFSPTLGALLVCRALLGAGESFNWPCALRATSRLLPPADRSLGNGIFNSGAAVGAVVTPLVVTPLSAYYDWRLPFVAVGLVGFVWVGVWLAFLRGNRGLALSAAKGAQVMTRPPARLSLPALRAFGGVLLGTALLAATFPRLGLNAFWLAVAWLMGGLLLAARLLPREALAGTEWLESLGTVVRLRRFWVLVIVSLSVNVCWHFLVNWLPTYLKEDRKMTFLQSGLWSALPFLAADIGNLGGGALSRFWAGRGLDPARARARVMAACALLVTSGAWVGLARSDALVLTLLALMALGTAALMANYFAFTQEVSPAHTGLIVGILGGLGNLGAAGFLPFAGSVKDQTGGFGLVFLVVGLLPFIGIGALYAGWGKAAPVGDPELA